MKWRRELTIKCWTHVLAHDEKFFHVINQVWIETWFLHVEAYLATSCYGVVHMEIYFIGERIILMKLDLPYFNSNVDITDRL